MSKHLKFVEVEKKPKTSVYDVESKHDGLLLGKVYWHGPWRQYVFEPTDVCPTIWSHDCLADLMTFLEDVHNGRLEKSAGKKRAVA